LKTINVCSVCGKKLFNPIQSESNNKKIITAFCYNCWSKTKNGKKAIQEQSEKEKFCYSDQNLQRWI